MAPLTERDPNVSSQASRASVKSAGSRIAGNAGPPKSDTLLAAPGVLGMLRATTEIGDVGSLAARTARLPTLPRPSHQRTGQHQHRRSGTARLSTASSINSYSESTASNRFSNTATLDSRSARPRGSSNLRPTDSHFGPDTATSMRLAASDRSLQPPKRNSREGRSFTMTHPTRPQLPLQNHRSMTSLRNHPQMLGPVRAKSPFAYPTRLKRPGYRPSSPSQVDVPANRARRPHRPENGTNLRSASVSPVDPYGLNGFPYPPNRNRSAPALDTTRRIGSITPVTDGTPSSEGASFPPTPKDGNSLNVVIHHESRNTAQASAPGAFYYDYTEQFHERLIVPQPTKTPMAPGFVQRIKTILEERGSNGGLRAHHLIIPDIAELPGSPSSEISELPGSPVPDKITRDMVLAALAMSSSDPPTASEDTQNTTVEVNVSVQPNDTLADSNDTTDLTIDPNQTKSHRQSCASILTARLSIPESHTTSVIDFALRFSVPAGSAASTVPPSASVTDVASVTPSEERVGGVQTSDSAESIVPTNERGSPAESTTPEDKVSEAIGSSTQARVVKVHQSYRIADSQRPLSELSPKRETVEIEVSPRLTAPPSTCTESSEEAPEAQREVETRKGDTHNNTKEEIEKKTALKGAAQNSEPERPNSQQRPSSRPLSRASVSDESIIMVAPSVATGLGLSKIGLTAVEVAGLIPPRHESILHTEVVKDAEITTHKAMPRQPAPGENIRRTFSPPPSDLTYSDLRQSLIKGQCSRLSDVKEEETEEMSTTDLKTPPKAAMHTSRLSVSRPLSRESSHRRASVGSELALVRQVSFRNMPRPISEIRSIPSLNFSRMDLISKLNEALGCTPSRFSNSTGSIEPVILSPSPRKPISSKMANDRYRSFFLEHVDNMPIMALGEDEVLEKDVKISIEEPTVTMANQLTVYGKRAMSPDEIITEVNRLSIPSISGLTQRLSELLPAIKKYYDIDTVVADVEHEIESIHEIGRSPTVKSTRSVNAIRDSTVTGNDVVSIAGSKATKTIDKELPALPTDPGPVVARSKSFDDGHMDRLKPEHAMIKRASKRSLLSENLPWNNGDNYPWSDSTPKVELTWPPLVQVDGLTPDKRARFGCKDGVDSTTGADFGSPVSPLEVTENLTGTSNDTFSHTRRISKKSVVGSIKKKLGIGRSDSHSKTGLTIDNSGFATGPLIIGPDGSAVDPGDRYPTTGLTPPSAFNLEDVRSFFSDDSSITQRGRSFRKRLTHLKSKMAPMTRVHSVDERGQADRRASHLILPMRSASAAGESQVHSHETFDGTAGMSKMEFRARKMVDRLKNLWAKGGHLIRTMSGAKKDKNVHADADADDSRARRDSDMYPGV